MEFDLYFRTEERTATVVGNLIQFDLPTEDRKSESELTLRCLVSFSAAADHLRARGHSVRMTVLDDLEDHWRADFLYNFVESQAFECFLEDSELGDRILKERLRRTDSADHQFFLSSGSVLYDPRSLELCAEAWPKAKTLGAVAVTPLDLAVPADGLWTRGTRIANATWRTAEWTGLPFLVQGRVFADLQKSISSSTFSWFSLSSRNVAERTERLSRKRVLSSPDGLGADLGDSGRSIPPSNWTKWWNETAKRV